MVELTKSLISFSSAMSAFAAQQLAYMLAVQNPANARKANAAFSTVTQAADEQFNDLIHGAFQIGDELQRGLVDLMFKVLTLEAFQPSFLTRLTCAVADQSTETLRVLTPGTDLSLAWEQLKNNFEVYNLVKQASTLLKVPTGLSPREFPLSNLIHKAYALGQYPALWAVEGLGHDFTQTFWRTGDPMPERIPPVLTGNEAQVLPASSQTMMNAGVGLSFAQALLQPATLTAYSSPAEIRQVVETFITLVKNNARGGYEGAAYEALGLVTRTWHSQLVPLVDQQLREISSEVRGYYWHGIGRALYFLPIHFVPGSPSAWRAAERESPDELAYNNAIAGLTWAFSVVNYRQPEIMANFLKYHGPQLSKGDAFSNGVMSTFIMASDTIPENIYVAGFLEHQPQSDPGSVELWNHLVRIPIETAVKKYYPVLKAKNRLGEVFRYQSLAELVARLGGA